MSQLGPIEIPFQSWDGVYENPFFVADPDTWRCSGHSWIA